MVWSFNEVTNFDDLARIESDGGFVEDDDGGIVNDGLGDSHPLTVAFGEFADEAFAIFDEAASIDCNVDAVGAIACGHTFNAGDEM